MFDASSAVLSPPVPLNASTEIPSAATMAISGAPRTCHQAPRRHDRANFPSISRRATLRCGISYEITLEMAQHKSTSLASSVHCEIRGVKASISNNRLYSTVWLCLCSVYSRAEDPVPVQIAKENSILETVRSYSNRIPHATTVVRSSYVICGKVKVCYSGQAVEGMKVWLWTSGIYSIAAIDFNEMCCNEQCK